MLKLTHMKECGCSFVFSVVLLLAHVGLLSVFALSVPLATWGSVVPAEIGKSHGPLQRPLYVAQVTDMLEYRVLQSI
jgi:hypothetical protein